MDSRRKSSLWLIVFHLLCGLGSNLVAQNGSIPAGTSAQGPRVALVIGNEGYSSSPLENPVNDARGVSEALSACGFEVILAENLNRADMLRRIDIFAGKLVGADAGLFFYAGHGSQLEEKNYLLPVGEAITDEVSLQSLAIPLDYVVGKMAAAKPNTILIFLDACRNNPFKTSSRSGTRGLAPVEKVNSKNSLIAYATTPNSEAQDGVGQNSPFSGALIRELKNPGLEINDLMRNVTNAVATGTQEKQVPWVSASMREPFYFLDSEAAYKALKSESTRIAAELEAMAARGATLSEQIAKAKSADEKDKLLRDQQKLKAEEALKRQEADRAREETVRFEAERERQNREQNLAQAKKREEEANLARMKALAEEQKAALLKLESSTGDLASYFRRYNEFTNVKQKILAGAASAWQSGIQDFDRYWKLRYEAVDALKNEPWETAQEFQSRKASFQNGIEAEKNQDLAAKKKAHETQTNELTRDIDQAASALKAELEARTFTVKGDDILARYLPFDAAQKAWPISVEILRPSILFSHQYTHSIAGAKDMAATYQATDASIRAESLLGELDFGVRIEADGRFTIRTKEFRVIDLTAGNKVVVSDKTAYEPCVFKPTALVRFEDPSISLLREDGTALPRVFRDNVEYSVFEAEHDLTYRLSTGARVRLRLPIDVVYSVRNYPLIPYLIPYTANNFPGKILPPDRPKLHEEYKMVSRFGGGGDSSWLVITPVLAAVGGLGFGIYSYFSGEAPFWNGVGYGAFLGGATGLVLMFDDWVRNSHFYDVAEPIDESIEANKKIMAEWQPKYDEIIEKNRLTLENVNLEIRRQNEERATKNQELGYIELHPLLHAGEVIKVSYLGI